MNQNSFRAETMSASPSISDQCWTLVVGSSSPNFTEGKRDILVTWHDCETLREGIICDAAERRKSTLKGLKEFDLKARARVWP